MLVPIFLLAVVTEGGVNDQSAWSWDRETQTCALQQTSSSGDRIEVNRTPANDETGIKITVQAPANFRDGHIGDATLKLDSGAASVADVYARIGDRKRLQLYAVTEAPTFIAMLSNASALEISFKNNSSIRVPLRSAAAATKALRICEDQKMREWGIDPTAWQTLKSRPVPIASLRERFSDIDYPLEALTFLVTGDAVTRLDVAPDGSVQRCRSLNAGQYKGFEDATCRVLKGARFKPGLDSTGSPVSAPYVVDVTFRIAN